MKYVFKYPFENISNQGFVVSHQIHLDVEQRRKLRLVGESVEVYGVCVPVLGIDNSPSQEVFCKYKIIAGNISEKVIKIENYGWSINLFGQGKFLDDIKNGGTEFMSFIYDDMIELNSKLYPTLHQVVISDRTDLDNSLYLDHLFQTSSK